MIQAHRLDQPRVLLRKGRRAGKFLQENHGQQSAHERHQPSGSQTHKTGKPSGTATGRMLNVMSTKCISHAQTAMRDHDGEIALHINPQQRQERQEEMAENDDHADQNHVPFSRTTYQKVSSGMLAFQMMKYCANVM